MNSEISNQIKELRKLKGYTQREFADLLGVGQTTIANYERGIRFPDTDKLNKIANLFDVTVDYLLGRGDKTVAVNKKDEYEIRDIKSMEESYRVFINYLIEGHKQEAETLISSLHEGGISIGSLYFDILGKALKEVGVLWEKGSIDVWKEHFISESILDIMRVLKVKEKKGKSSAYSIIALTSGPEMHNIGLRMISDLLEVEGWRVIYLGSNLPVQSLIKAIEAEKIDVLAVSVTLTYHIESVRNAIAAVRNHFGRKAPKIIVGGAAFINYKDVCKDTGADYYGVNVEDIKALAH